MIHTLRICILTALVASLSACATTPHKPSSAPAKKQPTAQTSAKTPYDFRREGTIPPATDTRVESDVEEIAVTDSALDVAEAEAPPDTVRAAPADSLVDGFRIQVFASSDRAVAEETRGLAAARLAVPAYLDLEAGVYKVRVGDYTSRPAADAALATVRERYPDAWVVPARVTAPGRRTR